MEQWEIDYRKELETTLEDKTYTIHRLNGKVELYTKAQFIDYSVEIEKLNRDPLFMFQMAYAGPWIIEAITETKAMLELRVNKIDPIHHSYDLSRPVSRGNGI